MNKKRNKCEPEELENLKDQKIQNSYSIQTRRVQYNVL